MKEYYDSDVRLNAYGQVDVDYYIAEAKRLRAAAFAELLEKLLRLVGIGSNDRARLPVGPALKH